MFCLPVRDFVCAFGSALNFYFRLSQFGQQHAPLLELTRSLPSAHPCRWADVGLGKVFFICLAALFINNNLTFEAFRGPNIKLCRQTWPRGWSPLPSLNLLRVDCLFSFWVWPIITYTQRGLHGVIDKVKFRISPETSQHRPDFRFTRSAAYYPPYAPETRFGKRV